MGQAKQGDRHASSAKTKASFPLHPAKGIVLYRVTSPTLILSEEPIIPGAPSFLPEEGAEVQFLGMVRGMEDGRPITGIDYTVYRPMAEKMLQELADRGSREHGPHRLFIQHRLGFVASEDVSIIIRVCTKHSAEAFDLCRWYLKEIKTSVPIWKRAVFA